MGAAAEQRGGSSDEGGAHVAKPPPKKKPAPRYMEGLLKMAELRKAERELTKEKLLRAEREREEAKAGTAAAAPQVYVTKNYLRRMKEREAALKSLDK